VGKPWTEAASARPKLIAITVAVMAIVAGVASAAPGARAASDLRHVLFVGNNWDGTATVVRPRGDFAALGEVNIIPDIDERMLEIATNPERLGYFLAVRELIGEGHDQFVDDMFTSNDGRLLIVSRPSLADVVGIDLATDEIAWRFPMTGQRSDHMGLSPDGKLVAVSDSTANVVHVLDTATGEEQWSFPSGDSPHENNFSEDGSRIYHASIGLVYTPADQPELDSTKGDRWFEVVNTKTHEVIDQIDMGQKLAEAGYPHMSSAVRPMALSPDERYVYFQVSFFHGFVEYDFKREKVTRVASLPNLVPDMPREQYLLDSAHHGLAMNPRGRRLCAAGTMDDYVAVVSRRSFKYKLIFGGTKPYWVTNSGNGRYCFVSWSGSDSISAISYKSRKEVATTPVGDHPQRMRMGVVRASWLRGLD
jgi:DNA-binding beta-propeller fold protein YncE